MTENPKYLVYKHTSPDGKVYIGKTCVSPDARWRGGLGYADNLPFFADILDHGWRNFRHEILATELTSAEAAKIEAEGILECHSDDPERGYNRNCGSRVQSYPVAPEAFTEPLDCFHAPRRVRCVETGGEYPSLRTCAKAFGVNKGSVRSSAEHGHTCRGYHFEFF